MKKFYLTGLQFLFLFIPVSIMTAQTPTITGVTLPDVPVEVGGKLEMKLQVSGTWVNPYDYDEIRVACTFFSSAGDPPKTVDGFFMEDFNLNTQTGALTSAGPGSFRVRFSPDKPGTWGYQLSITTAAGTDTLPNNIFAVVPASDDLNKGFIRKDQTNYLHFDDGTQYIPVGENIAWQMSNPYIDYQNWLTKLSDNDGNFFRLWQCSWGLGLEWKNGQSGYQGLRKYKQNNAFYTDWLLDFCAQKGIYIMYCLQYHGQVSTLVNPNWSDSPYNAVNGGPCANTWDFFTNTEAKNHTKNRYRYVLARWGYARNIMSWELFNEVGWTDQFEQRKDDISAWHEEMAAYLKAGDPNLHLVTTSYINEYNDPNTWNLPDIDFTQTHYYVETPYLERALVNGVRSYLNDYGKPTLNGEFGLSAGGANLGTIDPDGIYIHNSMWGSLFGGGLGTGMSWWWDNYIDPKNLYYHFAPMSAVARVVPLHATNMGPAPASVSGVAADLLLTPSQGWGAISDTSLTIHPDGTVTSAGAGLGQFLYGSQWNTQHRRPPVFYANYPVAGQFRVRTGSETGQSPKVTIYVDGVKVLEQNASVNQTYTVNISAGQHSIKVDNTGTDWITIASYTFTGLGTALDAYVLKSESQNRVAGWVLNNQYNHQNVQATGIPPAASGGHLQVPGVANGSYMIKYYDCLTGSLLNTQAVAVDNGALSIALPDILWDMAFLVEDQSVGIAETSTRPLEFEVFPSPATPGATIMLDVHTIEKVPLSVTLLDMSGRSLQSLFTGDSSGAPQRIAVALPGDLPGGMYWLKMTDGKGKSGTKAVVVGK